eukprot:CAMPEP_0113649734 /NCGR_PEP_ID=MMETSP0017_2-20120614/26441_1 /TAXON_ID=2856 /ORGANISM="Cylindrotheca closterium" /LENGTH=176 /DNA_ID=CAMNT_0000562155 /DNA_START=24 /DNA_END=551 /DNA_ORIENTATION=+ /assembly_acc=CAM_ASM_000147
MVRNDEQQGSSHIIDIVSLSPQHFGAARLVEMDFTNTSKGCCFGLLRFSWCPTTQQEFDSIYNRDETRRETYGVAILVQQQQQEQESSNDNNKVVGICKGRRYGQKMAFDESLIHKPKEGEFYIDSLAVTKEARGKGVGTKLLKWAEELALQKGDTRLELGVMKGNPAERLYMRFG